MKEACLYTLSGYFSKIFNDKGRRKAFYPLIKENFSLKRTRENVTTVRCVMKHLGMKTKISTFRRKKNVSNDQRKKDILTCQLSFG